MSDYIPTIDDIRVKMCYICREEESVDDPPSIPPRTWTHPCKCTLIAHESCLLSWIETAQAKPTGGGRDPLSCPQCKTKYEIVYVGGQWGSIQRLASRLLTSTNILVSQLGKIVLVMVPVSILSVVGAGTYWLLTQYGAYAVREFFGEQVYTTFLGKDISLWPRSAFFNLPLIPIFLVASRFDSSYSSSNGGTRSAFSLAYGLLPLVSALLEWPSLHQYHNYTRGIDIDLGSQWTAQHSPPSLYPPSPYTLGFVILPLVRILYNKALTRFTKWVLSPSSPGFNPNPIAGEGGEGEEEENALMVVRLRGNVGGDEGAPLDADADAIPPPADPGAPAAPNDNNNLAPPAPPPAPAPPAEDHDHTITIYASPLGRKLAGALLAPWIARGVGDALGRFAMGGNHDGSKVGDRVRRWLRIILAIGVAPKKASWWESTSLGSSNTKSWTGTNFGVGSGSARYRANGDVKWTDVLKAFWAGPGFGYGSGYGSRSMWREFDPVWYRSTLGLGLFVLLKDALHLLHLWLIKKEREGRRIRGRGFEGVDLGGLDLVN